MATRSRDRADRPSHPPLWLVEGLDIVSRKWVLLAVVAAVVIVLGAIAALVLPQLVPPTPAVGAAIGLAGLLLGLAAAVASDATDLVVRGPRHVAAAGGELVAVLPRDPSVAAAGPLAAAVLEVREPGVPLLLAFATASRDARRSSAWTDAIARSLVADGVGVLRVDLASGRSEQAGLVEVVRDGVRLADAVTFEPGVKLAQLSAGRDHADALAALTELPGRLPRDLDIMLVSLPTAASRSVVAAATALDHVLIIVERDRTSRVDLIASLDALESAGTHAQVVLLDTSTAMRLAPPVEVDPEAEAERPRTIASTVGTPPVVVPGSDGEPVPVPEGEPAEGESDEEPTATDESAEAAADEPSFAGEEPPVDEVAAPDGEEPSEATADGDREGLPFAGPFAAGVAGAGVAAGLAATTPASEDELDEAAEAPEDAPEVDGSLEDAPEVDGSLEDTPDDDSSEEPVPAEPEAGDAPAADREAASEPQGEERGEDEPAGQDEPASQDEVEDPDEPASPDERGAEQRDLELLDAAAAATAMSIASAEQEPFEPAVDEDAEPHDLEDELPQPGDPLVEELVDLSVEPEPATEEPATEEAEAAEAPPHHVGEPEASLPEVVELADRADPTTELGADSDGTEVEDDDPTDRLAPVQVSGTPAFDPLDADDQDLLRTTAQLAVLSDDLAARGRAEAGERSEPGSGGIGDAGRDDRA